MTDQQKEKPKKTSFARRIKAELKENWIAIVVSMVVTLLCQLLLG